MQINDSTVVGGVNVTFGNPSVYETQGRDDYLSRVFAASDSRIERRRAGAGLDEAQIARIRHLLPSVPRRLGALPSGQLVVLTGQLGSGKSDIAECWLRTAVNSAYNDPDSPVPIWVSIDDLESSLELHVQKEIGLRALETLGADIVVDGLDQRADRAERIIGQADSLTHRWPRSRVVLTSRATHDVSGNLVVRVNPLPKTYGRKIVNLVMGTSQLGDLRPEIEEALERPLFALLVGQQASSDDLNTMTEVIEGVVRKIAKRETRDLYRYLRELAVRTVTTGRPVNPEVFADFDIASKLHESPFLTATAQGLSFSLATFEQWFASRAVLENTIGLDLILVNLVSFDRWKYVLSMVLAAGEPSRVDPVMDTIARWNPGAIGWIVNETEKAGLNRYPVRSSGDDWHEVGTRLRFALEAMIAGLGPLSTAFTPFWVNGVNSLEHFTLAVEYGAGRVTTTWLAAKQVTGNPLPPVLKGSAAPLSLDRFFCIKTAEMPASRNWVWTTARNILADDLKERFTTIVIRIAAQSDGIVRREVEDLRRREVRDPSDLDDIGRGLYGGIYPLPDVRPAGYGWPGFSVEAIARRIHAVLEAAIECYVELCDSVAPKFGDTLAHRGMMPLEYYGNIHYGGSSSGGTFGIGPATAGLHWLLRPMGTPLPNGERYGQNSVNITLNDRSRTEEIDDNRQVFGDAFFQYVANTPGYEPFADSFCVSSGQFDLIDKKPATHIAVGWLWDDLKNLKWVSGLKPNDQTE